MYRILIVEDDSTIASIMKDKLDKWGCEALIASDFRDVFSDFAAARPHLVLMDINLPYYDGFYWCAKIRQVSSIPIIFISSRDTDGDKIRAITQGGDDYLEKPFSLDLLVAKVQAMLRRAYSYGDRDLNMVQYRDVVLNLEEMKAFYREKEIKLTPNECRILAMLVRNGGKVVSRTRLISSLWDDESFVDDNTLTVNVNRLRRKLNEAGLDNSIETVIGEGYRLEI